MWVTITKEWIGQHLLEMVEEDPDFRRFGADVHRYQLNPPVSLEEVLLFEKRHNIRLPGSYVHFITTIGNGGAGPGYGIFPLGMAFDGDKLVAWEGHPHVGDVSQIFAFANNWNLPKSVWEREPNWPEGTSDEICDQLMEAWDNELQKTYFSPKIMNGAIPLCDRGCGLMTWLVVTGEQTGYVWLDNRVDHQGLLPVRMEDGNQMNFGDWYINWIEQSMFELIPERSDRASGWSERHAIPEFLFANILLVSVCFCMAFGILSGGADFDRRTVGVRALCLAVVGGGISLGVLLLLDRFLLRWRRVTNKNKDFVR